MFSSILGSGKKKTEEKEKEVVVSGEGKEVDSEELKEEKKEETSEAQKEHEKVDKPEDKKEEEP